MKNKFKFNEEGRCPLCGYKKLDYGYLQANKGIDGFGAYYPWQCPKCQATGTEQYSMAFIEHYNVYDKNGNEILLIKEK